MRRARKGKSQKQAVTTKTIKGETVLDHEGGTKFYFKHLSPNAKARKKKARKAQRKARRR